MKVYESWGDSRKLNSEKGWIKMCDLDNFHDIMARKNDEYKKAVGYYSSVEKRKGKNESGGVFLRGNERKR